MSLKYCALPFVLLITLTACNEERDMKEKDFYTENIEILTVAPLEGCIYSRLKRNYNSSTIIRCPNSSVSESHRVGKSSTSTTTVIDAEEIAKAKSVLDRAAALQRISPEDRKLLGLDK